MPMNNIFPIRQGLATPRGENLQSIEVFCEGGLDLAQNIVEAKPGSAAQLVNFEVGLKGGYRRIDGFIPYSYTKVPGAGQVIGVAAYVSGLIIGARQSVADTTKYKVYKSTGTSAWTSIDTASLTFNAGMVVNSTQYNWTGTPRIVFTDGLNYAYKYDGTTFTLINGSGAPTNPKYAIAFNGYLFLAGYTSNDGAITISAPLDDTDYAAVDGAAEVVIGDEITGFASWRGKLIIFCRNSIWGVTGNSTDATSATPFKPEPISRIVGCVEGRTIQECGGDVLFLSQDGIRTISGTMNIGDTEIGSISRPIQDIVSSINPAVTPCNSVVVRKKTQYRLFYTDSSTTAESCKGILLGIRRFRDGKEGWEGGELGGIKPSCAASGYFSDGQEYVLFGGYDGYVYRMEQGSEFNYVASDSGYLYDDGVEYDDDAVWDHIIFAEVPINELYRTAPLEFGDYGTRKALQRVTVYYFAEGSNLGLYLKLIYDYGKSTTVQPNPYNIVNTGFADNLYNNGLLYDDDVLYNTNILPVVRQLVQGSGFVTQLQFNSTDSDSYVIQGFYIEYFPGGRR